MRKLIAVLCAVLCTLTLAACGSDNNPSAASSNPTNSTAVQNPQNTDNSGSTGTAEVSSITIKTEPKTEYFVDEKFTVEGGILTVEYTDGTTKDIDMTDPSVEITEPSTSRAGSKTVTVKYGDAKVTFKVTISTKGLTVTYDLNYSGAPAPSTENVVKGFSAQRIAAPVRDGYTFYNWYSDAACTMLFDFDTSIVDDVTIYAGWKENGATYHKVVFNLNYYGCAYPEYEQIVKSGNSAATLGMTPTRIGYTFAGWATDENGTSNFDAGSAITADTTVFAKWTRTGSGSGTYVFEAEDVDLSQKAGPGYSGENAGIGMIVTNKATGASGDKFVAYQCKNGNSLEFYVASDSDAEAVIIASLAAEFSDMTLTPDKYEISVNGTPISYSTIALKLNDGEQQGTFADYIIGTVTLQKGANLIQFKTTNNDALGGTLTATAPIIDCVKVETEAVVIWDGNYGLPMSNY